MTGPEHYTEAQNLLIAADEHDADHEFLHARAQVHAVLALAYAGLVLAGQAIPQETP